MNQIAFLEAHATSAPVLLISCPPTTIPVAQLTPIIATEISPPIITAEISPPPPPAIQVDPMEALWHTQFYQFFRNFWPCSWRLVPKPLMDYPVDDWNRHTDSAKVRFMCQVCGHGWTSMKGRVQFWYQLDTRTMCGIVSFALFGQKCQECCKEGLDNFTPAMWYQEEVVKVLVNVYNSVGQTYYGFQSPQYCQLRRAGKPRSQHVSELCQACQMGVCSAMNARRDNSDQNSLTNGSSPEPRLLMIESSAA